MRIHVPLCLLASTILLGACLEHPLKPVELEKSSIGKKKVQLYVNKDVDILFVMDNSGSMGEEQANLAANFGSFIEVLEAPEVEANYRIGVTTTDNGNSSWCPAGQYTPEGGKLVMSSCKSRLNDFISPQGDDVQDLACNEICDLDEEQLEISPTTTDFDSVPAPRPWLENIEGRKNIPEGTSTVEAFQCFGPQGVNGCGFESQLESMYLALVRAQSVDEASYGFLRPNAILAVVFVTDEADCSYNKDWSEIFETDGNRVFWSNPDANSPTSALCWNAGVECTGDPGNYQCDPINKDVNGEVGVSDDEAVLHPMSRYLGLIAGIEAEKQQLNPEQEVIVGLIGGVSLSDNRPYYSDVSDTDPNWQDDFGIGPGCEAPNPNNPDDPIRAVPPVRLREMTESFSPGNMFSICNDDYSPALETIANTIRAQIRPACYTECVEDLDSATTIVEPECTVEEDPPGPDNTVRVEECLKDGDGYVFDPATGDYAMPSDEVNVCYAALTDPGGLTPSLGDDMSPECQDEHYNLEFKIFRRLGFAAAGGTSITADCSLADFAEVSCPGIDG